MASGIINGEQARQILDQYPKKNEGPDYNLAFIIFGVVAVLLVGSGITLIFANQWENMPDLWKGILSAVPFLLGLTVFLFAWLRKRHSLVWRECASGFFMLMIAASVGLLAQTYHLLDTADDYWLWWGLLSFPLMYLLNSTMAALLFCFGLSGWVLEVGGPENLFFWPMFLLFVPHFWYNIRRENGLVRQNLLEWGLALTFTLGWFATGHPRMESLNLFGLGLWLSLFFLIGQHTARKPLLLLRPLQLFAIGASFLLVVTMNLDIDPEPMDWGYLFNGASEDMLGIRGNLLVVTILFLLWTWEGVRLFRADDRDPMSRLFFFFPLVVLAFLQFNHHMSPEASMVLGSAIGLLYAAIFLKFGLEQDSILLINVGMVMIVTLAGIRFFESDWSMLWKGIVFILLGLIFLGTNIWLGRRMKAEKKGGE